MFTNKFVEGMCEILCLADMFPFIVVFLCPAPPSTGTKIIFIAFKYLPSSPQLQCITPLDQLLHGHNLTAVCKTSDNVGQEQ